MRNYIFITLCVCLQSLFLVAQDKPPDQVSIETKFVEVDQKFSLSMGVEFSAPIGSWKNLYGMGVGVEAQPKYMLNNHVSIISDAGYIRYPGKKVGGYKYDPKNHIYFAPGLQLEIMPEVTGSGLIQLNVGVAHTSVSGTGETGPVLIGGIGYEFNRKLKDKNGVPVLSNLPFIGALFRARSFKYGGDFRSALELIIVITPRIGKSD